MRAPQPGPSSRAAPADFAAAVAPAIAPAAAPAGAGAIAGRLPSDRFAETLGALRVLGEVQSDVETTQDVTREYTDLETRRAVKQQTVARLRSLLDTHTAKLADVLAVENELARTVTELEQLEGEKRYVDQQIALSSIALTLTEPAVTRVYAFTDPVAQAFRSSVEVFGISVAGIVYGFVFIAPWAIIATVLWIVAVRTGLTRRIARPRALDVA
ncbi:MAG TPA: DUF4349 domain-containing protein [Gemmatimonadaceae bacterium]|nr:DUF4349 domain-containing protein [Gemmatimonadaceae bacterium]